MSYTKTVKFSVTGKYGRGPKNEDDVYTVEEFRKFCAAGMFIDYDGHGYPVKGKKADSSVHIRPSRLDRIPEDATHQDMFMVEGKVTDHFKPYEYVLEKEGLTHSEFAAKFKKGTIAQYLEKNELIPDCIKWLEKHYPKRGFSNKKSTKTFIDMLEHQEYKTSQGLGYWDASPHFFHDSFSALIGRNMFNGVHPIENRYLNVREMLHLMGLPLDFGIENAKQVNHIAQNVPVTTAMDMADEVKKFCNGEAKMTNYTFLKQDNTNHKIIDSTEIGAEPKKKYKVTSII